MNRKAFQLDCSLALVVVLRRPCAPAATPAPTAAPHGRAQADRRAQAAGQVPVPPELDVLRGTRRILRRA